MYRQIIEQAKVDAYLVTDPMNMRYISRMTNRDCTTRDGRTYLLRRDQAKEFRERYFSFVEAELKKK